MPGDSKRELCEIVERSDDTTAGDESEIADDKKLLLPAANDVSELKEKKRRLTAEQIRSLEISFDEDNHLEPDKKVELANDLGLQPRQVAIWFQNRRARSKTRRLEKDYNVLKEAYEVLVSEKDKLLAQISFLKAKLKIKSDSNHDFGRKELATSPSNWQLSNASRSTAFSVTSEHQQHQVSDLKIMKQATRPIDHQPLLQQFNIDCPLHAESSERNQLPNVQERLILGESTVDQRFAPMIQARRPHDFAPFSATQSGQVQLLHEESTQSNLLKPIMNYQHMMSLIQEDSPLLEECYVSNSCIGFIEHGSSWQWFWE